MKKILVVLGFAALVALTTTVSVIDKSVATEQTLAVAQATYTSFV